MKFFKIFILAAVFFSLSVETLAVECKNVSGVDAVVDCLLAKHPRMELAKLDLSFAEGNIESASQRINPTFSWQGTENSGGSGFVQEFNFMHTIEFGSKRSARVKLAESGLDLQKVNLEKTYNGLKVQLILGLYRYRQILHELEIVKENKNTFRKLIAQYKRIRMLNPEQGISLDIFTMTMEEVQLKYNHLQNEKDQILSMLEIVSETKFVPNKKQLPSVGRSWPKLNKGSLEGVFTKEANAKLAKAQTLYQLEKSKSWPNISIGPRLEVISGSQGESLLGAAVSLQLPLLSLNGGGRKAASALKRKGEFEKIFVNKKIKIESDRLLKAYKRSVKSHSNAIKSGMVLRKHKKLHKLISRGVVSPVVVIELHREIIDFYESLHEHELDAVRAKWRHHSLNGSLAKERVQARGEKR